MGRTRIELLTSGDIDMFDDVSTPLTFAVADIRTPDKRDSHFSKTIKVPATKGNNIRFGNIFDINLKDGTYNPNRKASCTLYIDDVPQINGFLQIKSIEIDDHNDMVYNIVIRGNVNNLFQSLGNLELSDLDFSSYNHILSKSNQVASWTNTYTGVYCYPLIDYGFDNNVINFKTEHLLPAIFVRSYIDKIFSNAGFIYSSSFFDSTTFKNLIIPSTGEAFKYSPDQIAAKLFEASIGTNQVFNLTAPSNTILLFDTDVNDPANAFNTGTYSWTVPFTAHYNLSVDIVISSVANSTFNTLDIVQNGTTIIGQQLIAVSTTPTAFTCSASNVYLTSGDIIHTRWEMFAGGSDTFTITANGSSFKNSMVNALLAGDTVVMNNTIPKKIKQKDFILDIIRMFNLYVEVDKNQNNKLLIETRDSFYTSGTIVDWSYKLDHSKPLELTPMGDLDFKTFKYSYKDDSDFYNKKHLQDYAIGYGNRVFDVDNDFLTTTNETKVMFSATPNAAPVGDTLIIPKIWDVDNAGVVSNKPFGIRILYNGGVVSASPPYQYVDSIQGSFSVSTYLYAGHLDSVTSPTIDLNFGVPRELYYDATIYTNANLFNLYHKKFITEITDPDSKVVTGYFYLTPKDITQLDFRNSFYFEGQFFRLNKIYDYNPIDESVTKCEFIKIKEGVTFTGQQKTISGGYRVGFINDSDTIDETPLLAAPTTPRSCIVYGENNVIGFDLRNSIINGSNNYVHGGNNIVLLNSSGCTVYDGLQNVTLINTSGTIVTESNSLYVNGYSITSGTIASLSNGWNNTVYSSGDYYSDIGSWTVDSADVQTNRWVLIGKTLIWNVSIITSTTASSPTQLYVKTPNGMQAKSIISIRGSKVQVSATKYSTEIFISQGTYLWIERDSGGAFANGDTSLSFSITFEIV